VRYAATATPARASVTAPTGTLAPTAVLLVSEVSTVLQLPSCPFDTPGHPLTRRPVPSEP